MADALKTMYNEPFLRSFGQKVKRAYRNFDAESFTADVLAPPWEEQALLTRMRRIATALGHYLPSDYRRALDVLYAIDGECSGFPYLFFPEFVAIYGRNAADWDLSLAALARFTGKSSAEFAIRPFLLQDPERTLARMLEWTGHPDEHVRRLASEGSRPRLPWGVALPAFKRDPAPLLPILTALRADPSLYVRKSVANHLNDIAKDHPQVVREIVARWKGSHPDTDWIVRHGSRTLVRKADPEILQLFGYAQEAASLCDEAALAADPAELSIGDECTFHYELRIREGAAVHIRIEYGIDFIKARGQTSRKQFLLSDKTVPGGARLTGSRTHSWAELTTRRHYPGAHRIVLLVNGREVAHTVVQLTNHPLHS